jgi:hypothetical protein
MKDFPRLQSHRLRRTIQRDARGDEGAFRQPPCNGWGIKEWSMNPETQHLSPAMGPKPGVAAISRPLKTFLDIPTAAGLAGLSLRHFRRLMEEDRVPVVEIGRKFFILGRDFNRWEASRRGRKA